MMEKFPQYMEGFKQTLIGYIPDLALALVTLVLGLWLISWVVNMARKGMIRSALDDALVPFLASMLSLGLKVLLFISIAGMVGIKTTSFIAVLGAMGLAVGLALQGSLANFAGGVLILFFKPFRVGDFITTGSFSGSVKEIRVIYTVIITAQNQRIVIPNGQLANSPITNFTAEDTRRLDLTVGISYDDDIDKAKAVLQKLMDEEDRILDDPAPFLGLESLGDNSVNLKLKLWTKLGDYWGVHYDFQEKVKKAFDKEGVSFPFPQMDVHLSKEN